MKSLRVKLLSLGMIFPVVLALLLTSIPSGTIFAASVADSWSQNCNPANVSVDNPPTNQDFGWVYNPGSSYTLTRIDAKFDQTTSSVTVEFYRGTPASGLTLLASGTISPSGTNAWSGTDLNSAVNVTSGTTYFVGFRNVRRTPTTNSTCATALTIYTSTTPSNYGTAGNAATRNAYRPIVRFYTDNAPVANADSYTTNEDTQLNVNTTNGVLNNDTDADGDSLTAHVVSNPSHGTLTLNTSGSFTYRPSNNYNGTDTFTYNANDGSLYSNTVTVTITINPVNDVPNTSTDWYFGTEDTTLDVSAPGVLNNDDDPDGDPMTALLVSGPSKGTLTFYSDGSFSYVPNPNTNGFDSFRYRASDGTGSSGSTTVNLIIATVNDPPVAVDDSYTTNENTTLSVNSGAGVRANDSDVDSNFLRSYVVSNPSHGTVTMNTSGSFTYVPNANYVGTDTFTYHDYDFQDYSNTATVTINVTRVDNAPVATDDSYSTNEDTALHINAAGVLGNDTDSDSDPITAALVSDVSHGSLTLNSDGSFDYTPAANYNGSDSFTYHADDGYLTSNTATVTINVNAVNDPPVASADSYTTNEDTALNVAAAGVLANDSDSDSASINAVLVSDVSNGTLTFNSDGSFDYTPAANYNGTDSFTYKANDGSADSNTVTVTINVTAVDDAPVATDDSYSTDDATAITVDAASGVLANDSDIDSPTLSVALVSGPTSGSVTLNPDGSFTYTPTLGFSGIDTFTYQADDGTALSNIATVTISVSTYTRPVAADDSYVVYRNKVLTSVLPGVLANDVDPNGNPMTAILVTDVTNGLLTLNADGSFDYTPTHNFSGTDTFTYKMNNGKVDSNIATVTITVRRRAAIAVEVPAPPPATACTDVNFENPGMIRSNFTNDIDRAGLYCRLIAADGQYMTWLGSPITNAGNVGSQNVLDLGLVGAVDVFSMNGATGFAGDVDICLKGSGYMIYMNANGSPRVPQLWSAWTTDAFPGYTCTTLYAPGTVILVSNKP